MKRILIALTAVGLAVGVQAASVDWSFSETAQTANNPLDLSGYTAYLFTQSAWETIAAGASGGAISPDAFTGWAGQASITTTSVGGGKGVTYATGKVTSTGDSGNYYVVLSDGSGIVTSGVLAATAYTDPTMQHDMATWTIAASATPITTAAYTMNVPEPTSGLLALLGFAALALKRRHA